jgi:prefoldin subunit 5
VIFAELGQYLQLKSTIEMIREQKLKTYNARVDVGQEFFMEAETKDLDRIMVKVSREYFVELS